MARRDYTLHGLRRQWASTTAWGDVASYLVGGQNAFNMPIAGQPYYVVSTSAQDTTAGTGVNRARIVYLDSANIQRTMVVTLNGLTPVALGTDISFVQWMETEHSTAPFRVAAGDISITSVSGVATEANTIERILAGGNRSQSLRYKVPAGCHAHLVDYHVAPVRISGGDTQYHVQVRATLFNDDNSLSNAYHFLRGVYLVNGSVFTDDFHFKEVPEHGIVKMSVIPTASNDGNVVQGSLDIVVIDKY